MSSDPDQDGVADLPEPGQPRFGSYIGLVYTIAILGILSFAIFYDVRPGHAFDRLHEGMTPTEVAAILGVPRAETKQGTRIVQTWQVPDGSTLEVQFEGGKLAAKHKTRTSRLP
jgi:hypothetical protein